MPVGTNAYGTIYYPVPHSEPVSALDDLLAGYVLPVADEATVTAEDTEVVSFITQQTGDETVAALDDPLAGYVLSVADEATVSASDDQAASTI